ncbi:hypothetical protein [Streptomyces sp. NBC_01565]|uniref:hypothetical protein n=1 Tax=unclassified Streptomyces TaxID=2593676 RepID=UPI002258B5E9|nr:hypothetical protein [Streptomyces sp. NBC_01565]MCX4539091.1 hypothetical protein [Streptomyces sp. NBC_01565]
MDYWDRPGGNWGLLLGPDAVGRREHANFCCRMGTKALRRVLVRSLIQIIEACRWRLAR